MLQVAEENGLEVMDQLEANPVSTRNPAEVAGLQTLTTEEEDRLSNRYEHHSIICLVVLVDYNIFFRLAALRQPN